MEQIIAYCGLDCMSCPAYIATQSDDLAAKERIAAEWRIQYNSPEIDINAVTCDGCKSQECHGGYCSQCPVRACGVQKGVEHCGFCADYACDTLEEFFKFAPQARQSLDALRLSRLD